MKKIFHSMALFLVSAALLAGGNQGLGINNKVDDFELVNIDSKMVALSDYNNEKGVVLIFTCNHCPYAKAYEDRIIQLHRDYSSKGYPVLAINPNDSLVVAQDSYSKMKARAQEKQYPFPYLLDDNHKVQKQFGAKKTPHVFLLENNNNEFYVRYIGTIDDSPMNSNNVSIKYLADAIEALLEGKKPSPEVTKAIGCSIKVKKSS